MRIAIHQPNFLPYIGYFHKMAVVDQFVLYDDVQYTKEGFINRNRIKTPTGKHWITVPALTKGRLHQKVLEVEIADSRKWRTKILSAISQHYGTCVHFDAYYGAFEQIMLREFSKLADLNIALIEWICQVLAIDTPMIRSSAIRDVRGSSTERIISICRALGASTYYSGKGGANYQDRRLFDEAGIRLVVSRFCQPTYPQLWGGFESDLSVIDSLFNVGRDARHIVSESSCI